MEQKRTRNTGATNLFTVRLKQGERMTLNTLAQAQNTNPSALVRLWLRRAAQEEQVQRKAANR